MFFKDIRNVKTNWDICKSQLKKQNGNQQAKGFLISPPYNGCNKGMQPTLGDHEEAQPLKEERYPTKKGWPLREWWKNHIITPT